jgi:hypothetical protein
VLLGVGEKHLDEFRMLSVKLCAGEDFLIQSEITINWADAPYALWTLSMILWITHKPVNW